MQFEYLQQITSQESIEIDDIGNTAIQTFTNYAETKVMIIKTLDGITEVIEFGPVNIDVKELPDRVIYTYERFEFNQRKLIKKIEKFIQDDSVAQVIETDYNHAKEVIKNLVDFVIKEDNEIDYDRLI